MEQLLMLATEQEKIPPNWVSELKIDGSRAVFYKGNLIGRRGQNYTKRFPEISISSNALLDGELVVFQKGTIKADFNSTLKRTLTQNPTLNKKLAETLPATYVIFDILFYEGTDVRNKPLTERQELLKNIKGSNIKLITELPKMTWQDIIKEEMEGLIWKNPNSVYKSGSRSPEWIKQKFWKQKELPITNQEFTEKDGFVIYVATTPTTQQKVVVNELKLQNQQLTGKNAIIKYLSENEGKLRQGSFQGVVK